MTDRRGADVPAVQPGRRPGWLPAVPAHVGVALGLATAGYAVTIAGVTSLQASAEATVAAARTPIGAAIDDAARGHDRLDRTLASAGRMYDGIAARYGTLADRLAEIEDRIAGLASVTTAVDGASRALPTRIAIPVVRAVAASGGSGSRPVAHATSGGSAP